MNGEETPASHLMLELLADGSSNFLTWKKVTARDGKLLFGPSASVISTNAPYIVPASTAEDLGLTADELAGLGNNGAAVYTNAQIAQLRVEVAKRRSGTIYEIKKSYSKQIVFMLSRIGTASTHAIEADPRYEAASLADDFNAMAAIIHEVHGAVTAAALAADPKKAERRRLAAKKATDLLSQNADESDAEFFKRYKDTWETATTMGYAPASDVASALAYMHALDKTRYQSMISMWQSNDDEPVELEAAFRRVMMYVDGVTGKHPEPAVLKQGGKTTILSTTETTAAVGNKNKKKANSSQVKATEAANKKMNQEAKQGEETKRHVRFRGDPKCFNCGVSGHPYGSCPLPLTPVLEKMKKDNLRSIQERAGKKISVALTEAEQEFEDSLTGENEFCFMINVVDLKRKSIGHVIGNSRRMDCEDYPSLESGSDSDSDSDVEDSGGSDANGDTNPNEMPVSSVPARECDDVVSGHGTVAAQDEVLGIFSKNVIVFDNGAGTDIFRDPEVLTDLKAVRKKTVGGVDANSEGILVDTAGRFDQFGDNIAVHPDSVANILSQSRLIDDGHDVVYDKAKDAYYVTSKCGSTRLQFDRERSSGSSGKHYCCIWPQVVSRDATFPVVSAPPTVTLPIPASPTVTTLNQRELKQAKEAAVVVARLGHPGLVSAAKAIVRATSTSLTTPDVMHAIQFRPPSVLRGKAVNTVPNAAKLSLTRSLTYTHKTHYMEADVMFIRGGAYLIGLLIPMNLLFIEPVDNRLTLTVLAVFRIWINMIKGRGFVMNLLRTDPAPEFKACKVPLLEHGVEYDCCAANQHCPAIERKARQVKNMVRVIVLGLLYVVSNALLRTFVQSCARRMNLVPGRNAPGGISAHELFTGIRMDIKRDIRVECGDYCQVTESQTDNTLKPRTYACIAIVGTGSASGGVLFHRLYTKECVVREKFHILPIPQNVITHLNAKALADGYTRDTYDVDFPTQSEDTEEADEPSPDAVPLGGNPLPAIAHALLPTPVVASEGGVNHVPVEIRGGGVEIRGGAEIRGAETIESRDADRSAGIRGEVRSGSSSASASAPSYYTLPIPTIQSTGGGPNYSHQRWSPRFANGGYASIEQAFSGAESVAAVHDYPPEYIEFDAKILATFDKDEVLADFRNAIAYTANWLDRDWAFKISVKSAMKSRPAEAYQVIDKELRQIHNMGVWHGVHMKNLSQDQIRAIIRSSMFLKEKYTAQGAFEKLKARLVAGGDRQDKSLYEQLCSPTAMTTSVFTVASIAAHEGRSVVTADITGAFLNSSMEPTGVIVHMRLDPVMTSLLVQIDVSFQAFVRADGSSIVALDKALYGTVEAARLWYDNICQKLKELGFSPNPYDPCVFNKKEEGKPQVTVVLHVDDMMITCLDEMACIGLTEALMGCYKGVTVHRGKVLDFIGMTFDFSKTGEVKVTMANCVEGILKGAEAHLTISKLGGIKEIKTPAGENLFVTRDNTDLSPKLEKGDSEFFHSYTAKLLYLGKRIKPQILTAVSFLSGRVQQPELDDLKKLKRVLGYVKATKDKGLVFKLGEKGVHVTMYADASYGVHSKDGKSHTGCVIILGDRGCVYAKSTKQKIVTKSSTEAELVAISDCAAQGLHLCNFIRAQTYDVAALQAMQDNMSTMALIARGGPASERSRHIHIREFWFCERVSSGEIEVVYCPTEEMWADLLTKPLEGALFDKFCSAVTNW